MRTSGGRSTNEGTRYQAYVVAEFMAEVLEGKANSVQAEPQGKRVDALVLENDGGATLVEVKSAPRAYTASLFGEAWGNFIKSPDVAARFKFVTMGVAEELRSLTEMAGKADPRLDSLSDEAGKLFRALAAAAGGEVDAWRHLARLTVLDSHGRDEELRARLIHGPLQRLSDPVRGFDTLRRLAETVAFDQPVDRALIVAELEKDKNWEIRVPADAPETLRQATATALSFLPKHKPGRAFEFHGAAAEQLRTALARGGPTRILLEGAAGSGKTTLLAAAARELMARTADVLFVRADQDELSEFVEPLQAVEKPFVLIDRLDAATLDPERFRAVLREVERLFMRPRVILVLACRSFDARNSRIGELPFTDKVTIDRLLKATIAEALAAWGVPLTRAPPPFVSTPLDVTLLAASSHVDVSDRFTLLRAHYEARVCKSSVPDEKYRRIHVVDEAARRMLDSQRLSVPAADFSDRSTVASLVSDGIFNEVTHDVEFFHQSFFEFVAGQQLARDRNIVAFARQHGLRLALRPVVQAALDALRGEPERLYATLNELLDLPTPYHLRFLAMGRILRGSLDEARSQQVFTKHIVPDDRLLEWFLAGLSSDEGAIAYLEEVERTPARLDARPIRWWHAETIAKLIGHVQSEKAVLLYVRALERELSAPDPDIVLIPSLLEAAAAIGGDPRVAKLIEQASRSPDMGVRRAAFKAAETVEPPERSLEILESGLVPEGEGRAGDRTFQAAADSVAKVAERAPEKALLLLLRWLETTLADDDEAAPLVENYSSIWLRGGRRRQESRKVRIADEIAELLRRTAKQPDDLLPRLAEVAMQKSRHGVVSRLVVEAYAEDPARWASRGAEHLAKPERISTSDMEPAVERAVRALRGKWSSDEMKAVRESFEALSRDRQRGHLGKSYLRLLSGEADAVEPTYAPPRVGAGWPFAPKPGASVDEALVHPRAGGFAEQHGRFEWAKTNPDEAASALLTRTDIPTESATDALAALREVSAVSSLTFDILGRWLDRGDVEIAREVARWIDDRGPELLKVDDARAPELLFRLASHPDPGSSTPGARQAKGKDDKDPEGALVGAGWNSVRGRVAHALGQWIRARPTDPDLVQLGRTLAGDPSMAVRAALANTLPQFWYAGWNAAREIGAILLASPDEWVVCLALSSHLRIVTRKEWPEFRPVLDRLASSPSGLVRERVALALADAWIIDFPGMSLNQALAVDAGSAGRLELARLSVERMKGSQTSPRARELAHVLAKDADAELRHVLSFAFFKDEERAPEPFDFILAELLIKAESTDEDSAERLYLVYQSLARAVPRLRGSDLERAVKLALRYHAWGRGEPDRLDPHRLAARAAFDVVRAACAHEHARSAQIDGRLGEAVDRFLAMGLSQARDFVRSLEAVD